MTGRLPPEPPSAARAAACGIQLDRALSYRLHLLHKLLDRDTQQAYLREAGLQLSEARCLGAVGSFGPLSVKDLAKCSHLDKGQASRAAQALVELELVQKQASGSDGRGVVLSLTRKGARAWQRVMQVIAERNQDVFGCLTAAEQKQMSRLFDRMIAHMKGAPENAAAQ